MSIARFILLLVLVVALRPVEASDLGAMEAARNYAAAMQAEGMKATARFIHPAEALKFRDMLLPVYEAEHEQKKRDLIDRTFGTSGTIEMVRVCSPEVLMLRVLTAIGNEAAGLDWRGAEALGFVRENEVVHVIVRFHLAMGSVITKQLQVVSFSQHEGTWKLMLTGNVEGIAAGLRALPTQ